MVALRVSEWKRHGLDRLYVNAPDGKAVAWFDRRTGHIEVVDEMLRQQILEALTPYMIRSAASASGAASTLRTPPPSDYDLASRRPGQALRDKIRADCPSLIQRSLAWALRRPENASWRTGLRGERIVSRELTRLRRHGWRALHSILLSPTWDIDHLLIGPGGVFSINTKHHRGKTVWVGDHVARINHGKGRPYPRSSRREAAVVKKVLHRGCGFAVEVAPVLVSVKPAKLTVQPSLQDVRAIENRELSALSPLTGVLSPEQVDAVYAVARDQRSWTDAV